MVLGWTHDEVEVLVGELVGELVGAIVEDVSKVVMDAMVMVSVKSFLICLHLVKYRQINLSAKKKNKLKSKS